MTGLQGQGTLRRAWAWFSRWAEAMDARETGNLASRLDALERRVERLNCRKTGLPAQSSTDSKQGE